MNQADGVPVPERYWAVATMSVAVSMAVLDEVIANIALPTIARDLHASAAASVWVVNAYQLTIMMALLPLAALGDLVGYRRIFRIGLAVFTIASLACAMSDSLPMLTAARLLQGFGAAGLMAVNNALIRFVHPRQRLGRGIAINAMVVAVSSAIGPSVAAGLLALGSWHWLFAVNVPVGVVALLASRTLPWTGRAGHRFDVAGAVLNAAAFGLLIVAIDGAGHGQDRVMVAAEFAAALAVGALLIRRQRGQPAPLLPVDLLRIPLFALSVASSVCAFTAHMLAYVALPFHLQDGLGRSQVETGLLMTPWPVMVALTAPIAGRLADRFPAGILGAIGMTVFALGLALLAGMPELPSSPDIAWRVAICGIGYGLFQSPNNRTILTSAPPERSGGASGMLGMARLAGQTSGAALAALVFTLFAGRGSTLALAVGVAFALLAALASGLRLAHPEGRTPPRT